MNALPQKLVKQLGSHLGATPYELESAFGEPIELAVELMLSRGLNLTLHEDKRYRFKTTSQALEDTTFCIVDIETNGSKPQKHQIIEIGAVKVLNNTIIDHYESLVRCDEISRHITEITGISTEDTAEAPSLKAVLEAFRLFLGDAVFVAHSVKFDYSFVSAMMEKVGLEGLMNRSLCTIDLTERTISSYRYGLAYLNEQLELYNEATHHRALSDAITAAKLFKRTLQYIPETIHTTEELIRFSKEAKRLKRPKFDPALNEETKEEKEEGK
jgi:DNA polymerase-3 subunit epsilon